MTIQSMCFSFKKQERIPFIKAIGYLYIAGGHGYLEAVHPLHDDVRVLDREDPDQLQRASHVLRLCVVLAAVLGVVVLLALVEGDQEVVPQLFDHPL